jgi:hypothetical protein
MIEKNCGTCDLLAPNGYCPVQNKTIRERVDNVLSSQFTDLRKSYGTPKLMLQNSNCRFYTHISKTRIWNVLHPRIRTLTVKKNE